VDELRTNIEDLIIRKNRIFEENKEHLAKININILKLMNDTLQDGRIKANAKVSISNLMKLGGGGR
jgi:hypothetical protein